MPQLKTPRHTLRTLGIALIFVPFLLAVAPKIATAQGDDDSQCLKLGSPLPQEKQPIELPPPPVQAIVFNGDVTIGGETPDIPGYTITARITNGWESSVWESPVVPVGYGGGCGEERYTNLLVHPPDALDLLGAQITFWLNGQVRSEVNDWFTGYDYRDLDGDREAGNAAWSFPAFRRVDLEFPALTDGYRPSTSLPPTGGAAPDKQILAIVLLLGSLATIGGVVAARRRS